MMKAGIYKNIPWASNLALSEEESGMYTQRALDQEGEALKAVKLCFDKEGNVDIDKSVHGMHFERIRRITGYPAGAMDRFNDGKRAEEQDRVTHE